LVKNTKKIKINGKYPPLNFNTYDLIETELAQLIYSAQNRRAPIPDKKRSLRLAQAIEIAAGQS
jgi:hypothetical protein